MLIKINALILFFILSAITTYSQESEGAISEVKKNAASLNFAGISPIIGFSYEHLLSERLGFEIGLGIPSIGVGIKYFPKKVETQKVLFYTGLSVIYFNSEQGDFTGDEALLIYLPFGLSFYGKDYLNFGIDIGPARIDEGYNAWVFFYGGIKVGKRF